MFCIVDFDPKTSIEKVLISKLALLLRHSKTDQYKEGKIIQISGELSKMFSK